MGAWGPGNFENDDALDWVYDLEQSNGTSLLATTLDVATREDYVEAPDAAMALAAAEVVATLGGKPAQGLTDEVQAWVSEVSQAPDGNLLQLAKSAVLKIGRESELKELWEDTEGGDEWHRLLKDLLGRLGDS